MKKTLGLVSLLASSVAMAAPSNDELQQQIDQLRAQLEATADAVENTATGSAVSIGGYGELHYNNLEDQKGNSDSDKIDFHRYVLFFNHEYNDRLRFVSELELKETANEEIMALDSLNTLFKAVYTGFEALPTLFQVDSLASIKLIDYKPNYLKYESNNSY